MEISAEFSFNGIVFYISIGILNLTEQRYCERRCCVVTNTKNIQRYKFSINLIRLFIIASEICFPPLSFLFLSSHSSMD